MMLTYGFSAKKSSGFGVIKKDIKGIFEMSGNKDKKPTKPEPIKPKLPKKKICYSFNELTSSTQPIGQANILTFSSFSEMWDRIKKVKEEVMKNVE